ncbi:putative short chain dehydrogenase/reductase [Periconia macrospinosa]|uniref:Putative short chain dehydrogenase/reductase n=1 Tax=Periconia macrospinosa TaxID=97972 RepID=A0A2V1D3F1_9PLEO|nr:putative short chain dehydrogenase/reductase [Periconia macrospinosa]
MKTAVITGCSPGGIGHALALELKQRGLRVFATGRSLEKISGLKESGIECVGLTIDDLASVAACHEEVVKLLDGKGLDYLFNNAGIAVFRPATESDLSVCKTMFGANVFGVIDMCQTFLPELLAARGVIVNMGSVAGHMPLPFMSNYSASKAALYAYSECMRVELAPLGVRVIYVMTGNVKTNTVSVKYHLGEGSLWYPVKDKYEIEQEKAATTGMDPAAFAVQLANQTLHSRKDTVWVGEGALMTRIISGLENYLPFKLWPIAFSQGYGMKRIGVHRN